MRKLLRQMAKAQMKKMGSDKINKRMSHGRWRQFVGAYPINVVSGKKMEKGYRGQKQYRPGSRNNHLFFYNWKFIPISAKKGKLFGRA